MDFEPKTTIYFLRTGIDEVNKVFCKTQEELFTAMTIASNLRGRTEANSFQRADGYYTIRVDDNSIPYYNLMCCDTIMYLNQEVSNAFYVVGNILSVEWKNPSCFFVSFKIDWFMTFQTFIDWTSSWAYVEREHVKEDWASAGGNPLFSNMGPSEPFRVEPDTPFFWDYTQYQPLKHLVYSPYDEEGKPVFKSSGRTLYSSLQVKYGNPTEIDAYLQKIADSKEASINNVVAIYGLPQEVENLFAQNKDFIESTKPLLPVNKANKTSNPIPDYNNAKCWSAPFVKIRLFSSDGDTVDFNPQWFGNDIDNYTLHFNIAQAGNQFAGIQCTLDNGNASFNWAVWRDFCVSITSLPRIPWTADGFTDWYSVNRRTIMGRVASGIVHGITGAASGAAQAAQGITSGSVAGAARGVSNVINSGVDMHANLLALQDAIDSVKASGAINSGPSDFNALFDVAQNTWGFKVVYYMCQQYIMQSVDQFFDRFGYQVNKLKPLGMENRPIWTFIKTNECHVTVGADGIPYIAEKAINEMFNHGCTIWRYDKFIAGRKIGDYSNAKENRGIKGA